MRTNKDFGGMDCKEILESYPQFPTSMKELEDEGHIYVVRNKDLSAKVIFYNDRNLNMEMSEEFCKMWRDVSIPGDSDLPKELAKAGYKSMEVFSSKPKFHEAGGPKKRRSNKRTKITNVHLEGIGMKYFVSPSF